jgi:shikimate dehydrogenase
MKGRFGLIGDPINNSLSPRVHQLLHHFPYELFQGKTPEDVLHETTIEAFNITAPYKHQAYQLCNELSEEARLTEAVNLVLKQGQRVKGWNTDVEGMILLLTTLQLPPSTPVKILGNGATSRSMLLACRQFGFKTITVYARSPQSNELSLQQLDDQPALVIQTIPFGQMTADEYPFDLSLFQHSIAMIDVTYHPLHTAFIQTAMMYRKPWHNGLSLLVAQAIKGCQHLGLVSSSVNLKSVLLALWRTMPIWLVGLPGSGKSVIGKKFATKYQRPFIDLDQLLEQQLGVPLATFIQTQGEETFRQHEAQLFKTSLLEPGVMIATGGGCILTPSNRAFMQQSGIVVWLDTNRTVINDPNRPLTSTREAYESARLKRTPLYESVSHIHLTLNDQDIEATINALEDAYENYLHVFGTKLKLAR